MKQIQLQPEHDRAIRDHGQQTYPHECCGFLLGEVDGDRRRVVSLVPADNGRDDEEKHNRFTISPQAFLKAERTARKADMSLLGFYHSHPNAPARPSQYDLDHAWPWYSYIIVSIRDGQSSDMTSWILQDDRSQFNEEALVVSEKQEIA